MCDFESLILIKCGGILSFILIKCADVVVLVRVSVAAVAAGCGSNGAAWTQGLISTAGCFNKAVLAYPSTGPLGFFDWPFWVALLAFLRSSSGPFRTAAMRCQSMARTNTTVGNACPFAAPDGRVVVNPLKWLVLSIEPHRSIH